MNQNGVTLIESVLIIAMVSVMVFLMANFPNALGLISKSKQMSLAREIAVKQIEDKRSTNYLNLVNDNSPISDSRMSLLPNGGGTVAVENCDSQICANGENIKKITVTVSWKNNNKDQQIVLQTLIGEGGLNQ